MMQGVEVTGAKEKGRKKKEENFTPPSLLLYPLIKRRKEERRAIQEKISFPWQNSSVWQGYDRKLKIIDGSFFGARVQSESAKASD